MKAPPLPRGREPAPLAAPAPRRPANRTGLPDALKAGVEALSGFDLSDVRVHRDSPKPAQLRAHAYAQGTDIHLAPGQERQLPHEAWHVVQQKQGRVRATRQLKAGVPVNDDAGLEREADAMGARAMTRPAGDPPTERPLLNPGGLGGTAPMQMVFVIRNGQQIWEDPYVPQPGDQFPEDFQSRPRLLLEKGKKDVFLDQHGNTSSQTRGRPVPTHKDMQKTRRAQGKALRGLLKKRPHKIGKHSAQLAALAKELERLAPHALPKTHEEKVGKLIEGGGNITGDDFRGIHPNQDEVTQSQATTHFLQGLRVESGDSDHAALEEYVKNALRLMSSLRIPTASVVAPISYGGIITGQQHPTKPDQPKLKGGASAHSFADRNRVEAQTRTFSSAMNAQNVPPNAVLLASVLSAAVTTLSTMSAPSTASNVASFNPQRKDVQLKEREALKAQVNLLAKTLGLPISDQTQARTDPWLPHNTPASPLREDPSDSVDPTTATQPKANPDVQRLIAIVQQKAIDLTSTLPDLTHLPDNHPLHAFYDGLRYVHTEAGRVDPAAPESMDILEWLHQELNRIFVHFHGLVHRPITLGPYGDPAGAAGRRFPSLAQFFAECGQMAAHNALVLDAPDGGGMLFNREHLAGLGNFANFVDEDHIREMLAAAGRPGIPVIGDLDQAAAMVNHFRQNDLQAIANHPPGEIEEVGLVSLTDFIEGRMHSLVMVINTPGPQGDEEYHWISLRVTRGLTGHLYIEYLDSMPTSTDHSQLFQQLRAFLSNVPPQTNANPNTSNSIMPGDGGSIDNEYNKPKN